MRKIETKEQIDKRNRRNQIIVGVVLIGLLVISTLGYSLMSKDDDSNSGVIEDKGMRFTFYNDFYQLNVDNQLFYFENLPSEVDYLTKNLSLSLQDYYSQPLYIVNPNLQASSVLSNIERYVLRYQEACLMNSSCNKDLPIKNCNENVLIFEDSVEKEILQEDGCVYIRGNSSEVSDAFVYKVLGIN